MNKQHKRKQTKLSEIEDRLGIRSLFRIEKNPKRGLTSYEWAVLAYALFTLVFIFFTYTKLQSPTALIMGRVRIVAMTGALWAVYRLVPCRFTMLARAVAQLALLAWWYPDTYELNRILPNLDHLFAEWEQVCFGFQPALVFSEYLPQWWFSELMSLGYASYYPLLVVCILYYFAYRYSEFERATFVLLGSFFAYYIIFVVLPVVGPQFYYAAIGLDKVAEGVFPCVGDYFSTHTEMLKNPGWEDGFFYQMVVSAHDAGERPTAAFPSSHVGITVVILMLAWHAKSRRQWLFWTIMPFFVLMFFATVYIQAHYLIDAIAGLFSGVLFYWGFMWLSRIHR
ncbi:MAG: phosphatase PAP2 family protein [Prevotella sp.]|nr:phosphatase PAP2 family protein [Prevotella sp.]